jgi:membrane dipeptidase
MDRRTFLKSSLAAGVAPPALKRMRSARRQSVSRAADDLYKKALSVDAMCFTTEKYIASLDAKRIEDLRQSGISLISLDVSIGGGDGMGSREWPVVLHQITQWNEFFRAHADVFFRVRTNEDVLRAKREGKVGIVYNLQDTSPIALNLDRVGLYYDLGVRQIQLSHNQRNFCVDSCWELTNAGLSRFGKRLIRRLNERRILVDVAHVGDQSALETIALSTAPVLASHTGCYALCPHPRSKKDPIIRAIAEKGGVICIYNMSGWMTTEKALSMDIYLRHLKHALDVAGEDHVGFGTDGDPSAMSPEEREWEIKFSQDTFDGQVREHPQLNWPITHIRIPELDSPLRLLHLTDAMHRAGYPDRVIEKVIGGNYMRLFRDIVG